MSSPAPQFRSRMPRLAEAAVERVRLSVVPRARSRAPRVPFVTLVTLILLGGVVGLLLFNTSMQQASFATTSLEQQATTLSSREQTLKMELDTLRDPQRVALRAQRLGMVRSDNPAFLDLQSGRILGTPTAASAADPLRVKPYPATKPSSLDPPVHVVHVQAPSDQTDSSHTTNQADSNQADSNQANSNGDTGPTSPDGQTSTGRND
jgi:cell division protein FtsB